MRVFFDCEFTGLHKGTTLISIGFVSENNQTFYAEFCDYDSTHVDKWIAENVLEHLTLHECKIGLQHRSRSGMEIYGDKTQVKVALTKWLAQFKEVEIWSDCLAYDWVLFNDIFGTAFDIPKHVYYIPFDICTVFKLKGIDPDISREEFIGKELDDINGVKHNALYDAEVIRACYKKLMEMW